MQTLSPADQLEVLLKELAGYSPELPTRPRLVAINKADLPEAAEAGVELPEAVLVSAMTGEGVKAFLHRVADLVELADRAAPERPGFILHRPSVAGFAVRKEGSTWIVEGASALRAVGFADLTLPEAADRSARNLARLGVDRALAEAGARPGDEVRIGDVTFEFELPASEVDQ
jgi:GTP-binding protein